MFKRAHFFRLFRYGCLLAGLCLAYGFFVEPKFLAVRHVTITSENWNGTPPNHWPDGGYSHWRATCERAARVNKVAAQNERREPQILFCLAGDYVNGHTPHAQRPPAFITEVEQGLANLGKLKAPPWCLCCHWKSRCLV